MIVDKRYGISADSCEFSRARETTLDKIHLIYGNNCIASDTRAGYAPRCVYLTSIARKDGKEKRRHAREEFAARFAHRQAARQVIYPPRDASDAGAIIGVDDDRRPSLALNIPDASGQKSRAACLCAAIYNRLVLPRLLSGYFTAESHSAGAGERGGAEGTSSKVHVKNSVRKLLGNGREEEAEPGGWSPFRRWLVPRLFAPYNKPNSWKKAL